MHTRTQGCAAAACASWPWLQRSHGPITVISIWYYGINYGRYTAVLWTYTREYYGSITANCGQRIGFGLEEQPF